jgi:limonene-1,2-epoxide hydrolase
VGYDVGCSRITGVFEIDSGRITRFEAYLDAAAARCAAGIEK